MDYKLVRSGRRTLAIEISSDAEVIVRAPYLVSKSRIDSFVEQNSVWIERKLATAKERMAELEYSRENEALLRARAREVIPDRVRHYAALMGAEYTGVKITGAEKRFGSCSSRGSLCFSFRLMMYPPAAIDYVVVHELAHTFYHDHGKNFYALIERYMPDYKEREKILKGPISDLDVSDNKPNKRKEINV